MLKNYVDFFFLIPLIEPEIATHGLEIVSDENGISLRSNVDENAPEKVQQLFNDIDKKLQALDEDGKLDKLEEDDIEQILGNIFTETLGEPESVEEEIIDGKLYEKKLWRIEDGVISKNIIKSIDENDIKYLDEDSIEYLEAKLADSIKHEDYEKAVYYRDEINKKKKKNKRKKK